MSHLVLSSVVHVGMHFCMHAHAGSNTFPKKQDNHSMKSSFTILEKELNASKFLSNFSIWYIDTQKIMTYNQIT